MQEGGGRKRGWWEKNIAVTENASRPNDNKTLLYELQMDPHRTIILEIWGSGPPKTDASVCIAAFCRGVHLLIFTPRALRS